MRIQRHLRRMIGQDIVEIAVGAVVLLVIGMCFLNAGVLVVGQQVAGTFAKDAARSAANQTSNGQAQAVVQAKVLAFANQLKAKPGGYITSLQASTNWNANDPVGNSVTVTVLVSVKMPFPVPLIKQTQQIIVADKERIVGI